MKNKDIWIVIDKVKLMAKLTLKQNLLKALRATLFLKGTTQLSLTSTKNPFRVRNGTSDIEVYDDIFLKEVYKLPETWNPKIIVDAGANVGAASVYFANCFPDAQIIAVEPEKSNYEVLNENVKYYKNIKSLKVGIWSTNTALHFLNHSYAKKWAYRLGKIKKIGSSPVLGITIANLMSKYSLRQIDLLKVDIEGAEKEIFQNNCASWLTKTRYLIVEIHKDIVGQDFFESFFQTLITNNFRLVDIRGDVIFAYNSKI